GTVTIAGCCSTHGAHPPVCALTTLATTATSTRPPPAHMPTITPSHVSLRHHTPRTSSGANVDAASANDMPTLSVRSSIGNSTASATATRATTRLDSR